MDNDFTVDADNPPNGFTPGDDIEDAAVTPNANGLYPARAVLAYARNTLPHLNAIVAPGSSADSADDPASADGGAPASLPHPHENDLDPVPAPILRAPVEQDASQDPPVAVGEIVVKAPRPVATGDNLQALRNQISAGEGTSDAAARRHGLASGYDAILAYGAYAQPDKPVSQMTLNEIDALQGRMLANPSNQFRSSALGKYQIVRKTLRNLKAQMGLSDDEIYSPSLQDRLANALLQQHGLDQLRQGALDTTQYQERLTPEWASIARPSTGLTQQGKKPGTTTQQIQPILKALQEP